MINKTTLLSNLFFCCIAGIYSGIVLFSVVASLFFQSYFKGTEVLSGYALAIGFGAGVGLFIALITSKLKSHK